MENNIIAIDQSTSATKAMLFDERCNMLGRYNIPHQQYYPKAGWVEHDAEEIYENMVKAVNGLFPNGLDADVCYSLALTNQRETVVVWSKNTGKPVYNALVWQDTRGVDICRQLRNEGFAGMVQAKSGLLIDPNFSASGVKWLLDNVEGLRQAADGGELLMGTIDCWLVWKLTCGRTFATDYTNASRTMLFNIHTMDWDDELLALFDIPRSMMPALLPCDTIYGETTVDGLFAEPIQIAGVLGDSHGALVGQMCFKAGSGKVTYGTGSSVMVNIGEQPLEAPAGLVTSVGFTALGKTFFGYEGNIYSTGATIKWLQDRLKIIADPSETDIEAMSVADNGGVYFVPAFAGLGAPWWQSDIRAAILGMTFNTTRAHVLRAALESIAYQIKDLVDVMTRGIGAQLDEICADGGPTANKFLMQFQSDLLGAEIVCTEVEDASALGAVIMNGFARKVWMGFDEVVKLRNIKMRIKPDAASCAIKYYDGWTKSVNTLIK